MKLLMGWWRWFGRQSRLNKIVIVGFLSALVLFLVPVVVSWFKPTPIHVGIAFYTYERAFLLEGNTKTYIYENRNLVSDCSLRRIEQTMGNHAISEIRRLRASNDVRHDRDGLHGVESNGGLS